MTHNPVIDISIEDSLPESVYVPTQTLIQKWLDTTLAFENTQASLSMHVVSSKTIMQLNHQYRQKNKPTNVLSFVAAMPESDELKFLGDLVLCPDVITQEAEEQHKSLDAHWAHMVVHGTLHLLGYNHECDPDAHIMESKEISILANLNIDNPYEESHR